MTAASVPEVTSRGVHIAPKGHARRRAPGGDRAGGCRCDQGSAWSARGGDDLVPELPLLHLAGGIARQRLGAEVDAPEP